MNYSTNIRTSLALAIGVAFVSVSQLTAAEPGKFLLLRNARTPGGESVAPAMRTPRQVPLGKDASSLSRASAALAANREVLGIPAGEFDFIPTGVADVPGGSHVRFSQRHRGIEVHRGEIVLSLDRSGSLTAVADGHVSRIDLQKVDPELTSGDALDRAAAAVGATSLPVGAPDRADLVIARLGDSTDRLVFRVWMTRERPSGDWEILVDAITGEVLSVEDRFVEYGEGDHVQGQGLTYLSDPLSAARALYGTTGFVDGNDADTDSLNAYRAMVSLDSLTVEDGKAWLRGPYCTVTNIESPEDPQGYGESAPYRFEYARSAPGFEAVTVYYHAVQSLKRIESLGFVLPRLRSLRLDPHGFQGKDNSHYSPSGNWIGFGTGGVDDAEDADVIWHEYGHAIQHAIISSWGGGECSALGEGYGDYWAGSYARSLRQWGAGDPQYGWIFKWDGHNEFWGGRSVEDNRSYPFDGLSTYAAGQVWASTLLDIQDHVGRDVADVLVLKSLFYLTGGVTARDAAYALMQADADLFGGVHQDVLRQVLGTQRGFLTADTGTLILVLADDAPDTGSGSSPASENRASSLLESVGIPEGYTVHVADLGSFDDRLLFDAAVTVVLSGSNPDPFDDAGRRNAIRDYVRRGGKILVEGSATARAMIVRYDDPDFARDVLGVGELRGPFQSTRLSAAAGRLFSVPRVLPYLLSFDHDPDAGERYGITPLAGDAGAITAAEWDGSPGAAGIVIRGNPEGGVRSIFLSFSVGAMSDSGVASALLENAILALLDDRGTSAIVEPANIVPSSVVLNQNYPNPFNPSTTIRFTLTDRQHATLKVFDLLGRAVEVLVDETRGAGTYDVEWQPKGLPSGVYLCQLAAGGAVRTTRMVLVR